MSFHFYHLASLLHPKGSCLYPLPLALNVKPRSRKEADIRKFFSLVGSSGGSSQWRQEGEDKQW